MFGFILGIFSLLLLSLPASAATIDNTPGTLMQRGQSLLGIVVFVIICILYGQFVRPKGTARPAIPWHTLFWGLVLQFAFAIVVLRTPLGRLFFQQVSDAVSALLGFTEQGASFLFGDMVKNNVSVGVPAGDKLMGPIAGGTMMAHTGAYFAFNVLPTIIFFSALSTLLYHSGIMGYVVGGIAWVMQRSMKTSGAETLSSAANIFLGQTEAPLLVKPFIARATNSELMAIMVGGFANIASGVLAAYVGLLQGYVPEIAGHLLAASLISAPCSLVVAKLMLPETSETETGGKVRFKVEKVDANAVDAAARGALEGAQLAFNVAAMLIAFIALVALFNSILGVVGSRLGIHGLSLERILGDIMAPFAWLTGVPWSDAGQIGSLLGVKLALNEFVAYLNLSTSLGQNVHFIQGRSVIIASYALCGFANFSSIAIQIGGISGLAPERRHDLSKLGFIAMIGGTISSLMTACVVGVLL